MLMGTVDESPLPLPLTAFERFMIANDCKTRPMTFSIEIVLSGDFRETIARLAMQRAVDRHPLLNATVARVRGRRCWVENKQSVAYRNDGTPEREKNTPGRFIDISTQSGLKVFSIPEGDKTRVSFLFHHAATDGIGAMRFIGDFLGTYGQLTAEHDDDLPQLSTLSKGDLQLRGQLWSPDCRSRGSLKRAISEFVEFAKCWPKGVNLGNQSATTTFNPVPFVKRKLSRKPLRELKRAAMKHRVNPNDVFLACLFATIDAWDKSIKPSHGKSQYRIAIPSSLRTADHDKMPAANVLSFVFVQSSSTESRCPTDLARKINRELPERLENRVAGRLISKFGMAPGGPKLLACLPTRLCTAVLANVGEIKRHLNCRFPVRKGKFVAGSVVLEGLYGAPPVQKGTPIAISIGSYAGELLLNFNCDPLCLSDDQAERFADLFMQKLAHLVAGLEQEVLNGCKSKVG